jgi:hypothetical protein
MHDPIAAFDGARGHAPGMQARLTGRDSALSRESQTHVLVEQGRIGRQRPRAALGKRPWSGSNELVPRDFRKRPIDDGVIAIGTCNNEFRENTPEVLESLLCVIGFHCRFHGRSNVSQFTCKRLAERTEGG